MCFSSPLVFREVQTSCIGIMWNWVRNTKSQSHLDLLNQNLHFNKASQKAPLYIKYKNTAQSSIDHAWGCTPLDILITKLNFCLC